MSSIVPPPWLNGDQTTPRGTRVVGGDRQHAGSFGADELDVVAVGDAEAVEVEWVDVDGRTGREVDQRPRHLRFRLPGRTTCDSPPTDSHSCSDPARRKTRRRAQPAAAVLSTPLGSSRRASTVAAANPGTVAATSAGDVVDGRHAAQRVIGPERVLADHQAEFDRDHPVGPARAGGRDLLGERGARDPRGWWSCRPSRRRRTRRARRRRAGSTRSGTCRSR